MATPEKMAFPSKWRRWMYFCISFTIQCWLMV